MKQFSIILFSIFLSFSSLSQQYKFEVGTQLGPNLSLFRFDNQMLKDNTKNIINFTGNIFIQYNFNKTFSLKIQPGYENKVFKFKPYTNNANDLNIEVERGRALNYLTIPLLLKASIGNKVKYYFNAGPYVGFILSETFLYSYPYSNEIKKMSLNDKTFSSMRIANSIDIGVTSGIGMDIPIKDKYALSFELRDNFGLANINSSNPYRPFSVKTHTLNLLIGFAYKFGPKK